ncbi:hypothetical protein KKD62_03755 [Patescibacteria group bacterium]|nr:hypothetical protein [Patescibacteria group bacterium]MBU1931122.1 hypothetical protein [Patescibacteria group bacterium]
MKKIKFPWGELFIIGTTDELSVGIDIIHPKKQTDKPSAYLKKGVAIYYVIKGRGLCDDRPIKKGDLLKLSAGQKINLKNNSKTNLKIITIYLPPYDEANIGH